MSKSDLGCNQESDLESNLQVRPTGDLEYNLKYDLEYDLE